MTDRARRVLVLAQEEARLTESSSITTLHLVLGLMHEGEGVAAIALRELGFSLDEIRGEVEPEAASNPLLGSASFTQRTKKVLDLSLREALTLGHNYIGTEHVLLGLVREGEGSGARALEAKVPLSEVRKKVIDLLRGYDKKGRATAEAANDEADEVVGQWNLLMTKARAFSLPHPARPTVASVEAWLAEQRFTLWADWNIASSSQRKKAATWFVEQLDSMRPSMQVQPIDLSHLDADMLTELRLVAELARSTLKRAGLA